MEMPVRDCETGIFLSRTRSGGLPTAELIKRRLQSAAPCADVLFWGAHAAAGTQEDESGKQEKRKCCSHVAACLVEMAENVIKKSMR